MSRSDPGKAEQQEAAVSEFIEEHRPILEDPEAGYNTLARVYTQGADLLSVVSSHNVQVANLTTDAANSFTAAINDPHCSAGNVNEREKEYASFKAETERLAPTFGRLDAFLGNVKARLDSEFDEKGVRTRPVAESEEAPRVVPDRPTPPPERRSSWFHRLFGAREKTEKPEPSEQPVPAAEDDPESDREDYEKLLSWYEQNLDVLEATVATRQRHEAVYESKPEMVERWQETHDKLAREIAWAERNMDAIEQRNLAQTSGEFDDLFTRREALAARRSELEITS